MMTKEDVYWLWLFHLKVVSRKKKREMLEYFGSPYNIYMASIDEIKLFLSREKLDMWEKEKNLNKLKLLWKKQEQSGCAFYHRKSEQYPKAFMEIDDSPIGFYLRGRLPNPNQKVVAIVGSRQASVYGIEVASLFAKTLAKHGVAIVSGLAYGIDAAAHEGALEVDGYTLGVVGGGINTVYPRENYGLYMRMESCGGIISEYLPNDTPMPFRFPERNRLISAIADAIIVVEAKEKSGTFITVDQGLEQGKDIYAIPGRITDGNSIGCLRLISQGARPLITPEELLIEWGFNKEKKVDNKEMTENLLAVAEKIVYSCVRLEPLYIEEIIQNSNLLPSEVISALLSLELKGYIKQVVKSYYIRVWK